MQDTLIRDQSASTSLVATFGKFDLQLPLSKLESADHGLRRLVLVEANGEISRDKKKFSS